MEKRPSPQRLEKGVYKNIPVTQRPEWVYADFLGLKGDPESYAARLKDKTILDLGAGRAAFIGELVSNNITQSAYAVDFIYHLPEEVGGLDTVDDTSKLSREHRVAARLETLPFKDESAHLVVAYASLPLHADTPKDVEMFFGEVARVLAVGGEAYIGPTSDFLTWMTHKKTPLSFLLNPGRLPVAHEATSQQQMKELGFSTLLEYRLFLRKKYRQAEEATSRVLEQLRNNPAFEVSDVIRNDKTWFNDEGTPRNDSTYIKKLHSLRR